LWTKPNSDAPFNHCSTADGFVTSIHDLKGVLDDHVENFEPAMEPEGIPDQTASVDTIEEL